jgi:hypothetical protein
MMTLSGNTKQHLIRAVAIAACVGTSAAMTAKADHPMPPCGTVLIEEDFESCPVGAWIGDCNGWQTWANGNNPAYFFITDEDHVSGTQSLHVSGLGSCWEGAAWKAVTGTHVLLRAMMKASGDGPNGCHHYQNGIEINAALWSFDMPVDSYEGGLTCYAAGGGSFTAVEGFDNAVGQWYAVAVELDYDTGMAYFWLDDDLVWSTEFNTDVQVERVWMRSGEGRGWFDDVVFCEVDEVMPGPTIVMREPKVTADDVHTGPGGVSSERILFSEAVLFDEEDVTITDADGQPVGFDVSGNNSQFMLISFGEPLLNDIYTITIADTVVSADGEIPIDGDNDGESGGDAIIVMEHRCRHDGDNSGAIATPDLLDLLGNWGECP